MKFILGKKLEMTQVWQGEKVVPVTKVAAGTCVITQVKSEASDGYKALQVGFGVRKEKNINKPQKGHTKGLGNFAKLKEFRFEAEEINNIKRGDKIDINSFAEGDKIQVVAVSKGKGFQGVVRRHGFKGSKKTHGNKDQLRMPGSIGATGPAHVFKGTRMAGRMGNDQVTVTNLEVIKLDLENNIIYIKGAVPGARNGLVMVAGAGELKVISAPNAEAKADAQAPAEKETAENKTEQAESKTDIKIEAEKEGAKAPASPETPEQVEKEVVEAKEKVDSKKSE